MMRCRNPLHKDDKESCAVYVDGLKCFGCGMIISRRLDTLAYLIGEEDVTALIKDKTTLKKYSRDTEMQETRTTGGNDLSPLPRSAAKVYEHLLGTIRANRRPWLLGRGLSGELLRIAHIGHSSTAFTIPVYDSNNDLYTFRYRQDFDVTGERATNGRPYPKYYGYSGRNQPILYPVNWVKKSQPDKVYVVEGELDALRLWQEGIPAVSMTNGGQNMQRIPELLKLQCPSVSSIVVVGDMDTPGRIAATSCYNASVKQGFNTKEVSWDACLGKDVTEYMMGGRKLWQTFTNQKRSYLQNLV